MFKIKKKKTIKSNQDILGWRILLDLYEKYK